MIDQLVAQVAELERGIAEIETRERVQSARGWRDDFFGDVLDDRYEPRLVGAGSSLVLQAAHGGILRLTAGPAINRNARIQLGDSAYTFNSLDPDNGFRLIGRWSISSTAAIRADMFVNAPSWNQIHIVADSVYGPNWYLRTDNDSGIDNVVDSGVAADTAMHWHVLEVRTAYAAHWMDGRVINTTTVKIPTAVLAANVRCLANAAASKWVDLDYFAAIPQALL